ncbi:MAG: glycosyltransferase family 39 protein [Planctomycetota bacterium]
MGVVTRGDHGRGPERGPGSPVRPRAPRPAPDRIPGAHGAGHDGHEAAGAERWALPAVLAVALLLRLPGLGESLWLDETFCSHLRIGTPLDLARTMLSDYHPPFYFVLMHAWIRVFGDSELSLRAVPLLSGLLSIYVTARLGERLLGRREGLVAAALLALSPTHVWYSQEARPYMTTMLCVLCAAWACAALDERDLDARTRRRRTWAYGLALGAALFSHWYVVAFLAAFTLWPWLCGHAARRRVTAVNVGLGLALVLFLVAKSRLGEVKTGSAYLGAFGPAEAWRLLTGWLLTGDSFTPRGVEAPVGRVLAVLVAVLVAALLVLGGRRLVVERRADRRRPALLLGLLALPALLLALTLAGFDRSYIERSALPAQPFLVLVLAAGAFAPRAITLRAALPAALLVALGLAQGAFHVHEGRWTVYKPNPDWRALAAWLRPRLDGLASPVPMVSSFPSPYALSYYEPRVQLAKTFVPADDKLERAVAGVEGLLGSSGPGGWLAGWLRDGYAEHLRRTEALRRSLRAEVRDLEPGAPLAVLGTEPPPRRCFVLCWPGDDLGVGPVPTLLADRRVHVVDRARFRMLEILDCEVVVSGR